jgi:hypothetical protein
MNIKKTTVLMAAVLAVVTVLAAGLVVLPDSVQDAKANPCAENSIGGGGTGGGADLSSGGEVEIECEDLYGVFN